ncbi:TIGR03571 family LLM class oxidoreductase [Paraburkholderia sp. LEh10]|uniref:TIGR03571 family LLM class oxidoreductase n=1 Tax=Paraburkholderia sp. LEh10 TaxID=2821353 RepID=UPI001AE25F0A|nr:TIGR03571 family LLM class oxidoreductase [Paraburkholderia sp. LEh10]MBP0590890.1 TIGR03571 family LLM class oxidoreductase [Paraburkholderia sp. LEh10]
MDMAIPFHDQHVERPPFELQAHRGYNRIFRRDALTVGLILPLETHPASPHPTMNDHLQMAKRAEDAGVAALWARDIPFYDPQYGDSGQIFEPLIYIGQLAAATERITLGTTGIVLPMREPLMLAKQINTLDRLTQGRIVIGMSSGDRPSEYPVFGIDFASRGERFRDAYAVYRSASEVDFPRFESPRFGRSDGSLTMLPKPLFGRVPTLAVGRSQQTLDWIATHMDGYLGFVPEPGDLPAFVGEWRETNRRANPDASDDDRARPLAFGGFLYLHPRRDFPFKRIRGGFAIGSRALRGFLDEARELGVSHVALNPRVTPRNYRQILDELHRDVLPYFPPND